MEDRVREFWKGFDKVDQKLGENFDKIAKEEFNSFSEKIQADGKIVYAEDFAKLSEHVMKIK